MSLPEAEPMICCHLRFLPTGTCGSDWNSRWQHRRLEVPANSVLTQVLSAANRELESSSAERCGGALVLKEAHDVAAPDVHLASPSADVHLASQPSRTSWTTSVRFKGSGPIQVKWTLDAHVKRTSRRPDRWLTTSPLPASSGGTSRPTPRASGAPPGQAVPGARGSGP